MRTWVCLLLALTACDDGTPDFTLIGPEATVELVRGQQGMIEVGAERSGGLETTILVTATHLRAGITPSALPLTVDQPAGTLLLQVETSATLGPIDGALLVGTAGDLERTSAVSLTVVDP
ncbi:MAG TPA: hypothetical protein VL172_15995 [Kofleriaceae bacterium]|nr:hypothetical protein [Kofleriaceae bacterium]